MERCIKPRAASKAAFSLIELLVVLAITGILAGLLFGVTFRSRQQAYKAQCMSNLKQIGGALQLYMQDNDGGIPRSSNVYRGPVLVPDNIPVGGDPTWQPDYLHVILGKYLKTHDVLFCPRDPYAHLKGKENQRFRIDHQYSSYAIDDLRFHPELSQDDFRPSNGPKIELHDQPFAADAEMLNGFAKLSPDSQRRIQTDHLGVFLWVAYDGSVRRRTVDGKDL